MHGGNVHLIHRNKGIPVNRLIDFSANINPLGLPDELKKLMKNMMDELEYYPDPEYQEMAELLGRFFQCNDRRITPVNGAVQGIYDAIHLIRPQKGLIMTPTFSEYRTAMIRSGIAVYEEPLDARECFDINLDRISRRIRKGTDMVVLCNPNNPTGRVVEKKPLIRLLELCTRYRCYLVVDESFIDFLPNAALYSLMDEIANQPYLVLIRSFTKILALPGLRIGAVIHGNQQMADRYRSKRPPWSVNTFGLSVARYLQQPHAVSFIRRTQETIVVNRTNLYNEMKDIPGLKPIPSFVNYLLVQISSGPVNAAELQESLLDRNILIRDCADFRGLDSRWFRVAVKKESQNRWLVESLKKVISGKGNTSCVE